VVRLVPHCLYLIIKAAPDHGPGFREVVDLLVEVAGCVALKVSLIYVDRGIVTEAPLVSGEQKELITSLCDIGTRLKGAVISSSDVTENAILHFLGV
jgi:hypothetical protein